MNFCRFGYLIILRQVTLTPFLPCLKKKNKLKYKAHLIETTFDLAKEPKKVTLRPFVTGLDVFRDSILFLDMCCWDSMRFEESAGSST